MPPIKIHVTQVKTTNHRLRSIASDVSDVGRGVSRVHSSLDNQIIARRGISSRLSQTTKSLDEIEDQLNRIYEFGSKSHRNLRGNYLCHQTS